MRAEFSWSTRKPIDTTSRRPVPISRTSGWILPSLETRSPSTPSMRGTEKPQMSASITPTAYPCSASAAARLVVIDDLPTPPFPEATITTLVVEGMLVSGAFWLTLKRALAIASDRSSWVSSPQSIVTRVTPGNEVSRARMSFWIWARRGQPLVVRSIWRRIHPSSVTVAPLAMPSSTMSLPSSGSITPRIKPMT